jgi:hypothetical protein
MPEVIRVARDSTSETIKSIIEFARRYLDDEQMKELAQSIGGAPEDAATALRAINETSGVLGEMAPQGAQDNATAIYRRALVKMGGIAMDNWPKNMPAAAARAVFHGHLKQRQRAGEPLLRATDEGIKSFAERFPHAAKITVGSSGPRAIKF